MSVTYTSDARFKIVGNPEHDDWNLRIDYVQPRDDGIYECQVNAEPKIYRAITLKVLGEFLSLPPTPETDVIILREKSFIWNGIGFTILFCNIQFIIINILNRSFYANKFVIFRYFLFFFFFIILVSLQLILVAGQNGETVMNKFHLLATSFIHWFFIHVSRLEVSVRSCREFLCPDGYKLYILKPVSWNLLFFSSSRCWRQMCRQRSRGPRRCTWKREARSV